MQVYWASTEYLYTKESSSYGELKGGCVYAFVKAFDAREALNRITSELEKLMLRPIMIEFISPYDQNMEWEDDDMTNHFRGILMEANDSDDVLFDDFYAYKK